MMIIKASVLWLSQKQIIAFFRDYHSNSSIKAR